jgi:hypothetical protein
MVDIGREQVSLQVKRITTPTKLQSLPRHVSSVLHCKRRWLTARASNPSNADGRSWSYEESNLNLTLVSISSSSTMRLLRHVAPCVALSSVISPLRATATQHTVGFTPFLSLRSLVQLPHLHHVCKMNALHQAFFRGLTLGWVTCQGLAFVRLSNTPRPNRHHRCHHHRLNTPVN